LLLCSPAYEDETALPLYVPGEAQREHLGFLQPVVLWVSPSNSGAVYLVNELKSKFAADTLTVVVEDEAPTQESRKPTHMLLYLNANTWSGERGVRLAEQVKQARADKLTIVMAHENDPTRDGCAFDCMFQTTPQELIAGLDGHPGLYKALATSFFPGAFREVRPRLLGHTMTCSEI